MLSTSSGDNSPTQLVDFLTLKLLTTSSDPTESLDFTLTRQPQKQIELEKNWKLLRILQRAIMIARQHHAVSLQPLLSDSPLEGLAGLQQAARWGEVRKARRAWQENHVNRSRLVELDHAAPLSPLRERDVAALNELFQREDMNDIEADVTHRLLQLFPEPCWEDDPFEFLQDFLKPPAAKP